MSDRLSRAIQRIAKSDPDLRGAIEATRNRGGQPGASGVGTSESERDRICCDGSVNDDANPGTSTRDPDSGGQDASNGLNSDDPADLGDMGPGSLTGVHDCATGEPVCLEGVDWIPPDGWDDPSTGPILSGWVEGEYYTWRGYIVNSSGTIIRDNSGTAYTCDIAQNMTVSGLYAGALQPGACNGLERQGVYDGEVDGVWRPSWFTVAEKVTCSTEPNAEMCVSEPPRDDEWPSDGCVNLAIKNGSIVGSKYDPENDGSYSKPRSEIELCDGFGNSFKLAPSAGGGWKTISSSSPGDGYLYDSSGRQIARISESEYSDPNV